MLLCNFFLLSPALATLATPQSTGEVRAAHKISALQGGLALADGDRFGAALCSLGDLDGDAVPDLAVGAPGSDGGGAERGAVWILFLQADGQVKSARKLDALQGGLSGGLEDGAAFGSALALLGDLSGDGSPELAVGAPAHAAGTGRVYVLSLAPDGAVLAQSVIAGGQNGFPAGLYDANDPFGEAVARLGDIDGNGATDLAIGRKLANGFGYLFVVRMQTSGAVRSVWRIGKNEGGFGSDTSANFGTALAGLGDLDDDGVPDLLVGDTEQSCGACPGGYWVLFLEPTGRVARELNVRGYEPVLGGFGACGTGVARIGDVDGDGRVDALVGAPRRGHYQGPEIPVNYRPETGAAMVVFLDSDGSGASSAEISAIHGGLGQTLEPFDRFGAATSALGDRDGDGVFDIAVGAPGDDDGGPERGALYLLSLQGFAYPSSARVENGTHRNRVCFANASPPAVGSSWLASVDATGHAGARVTGYLLARARAPSPALVLGGQELLLQLGADHLGTLTRSASGGLDTFSAPIPNLLSLFGQHLFAQGFILGGGVELCNALELVMQN